MLHRVDLRDGRWIQQLDLVCLIGMPVDVQPGNAVASELDEEQGRLLCPTGQTRADSIHRYLEFDNRRDDGIAQMNGCIDGPVHRLGPNADQPKRAAGTKRRAGTMERSSSARPFSIV